MTNEPLIAVRWTTRAAGLTAWFRGDNETRRSPVAGSSLKDRPATNGEWRDRVVLGPLVPRDFGPLSGSIGRPRTRR